MFYTIPNPTNPILGHNFIAPDTISYRNLYEILSGGGGHFNIGHYYVLHMQCVETCKIHPSLLVVNILYTVTAI
jgi:hypothetical protein